MCHREISHFCARRRREFGEFGEFGVTAATQQRKSEKFLWFNQTGWNSSPAFPVFPHNLFAKDDFPPVTSPHMSHAALSVGRGKSSKFMPFNQWEGNTFLHRRPIFPPLLSLSQLGLMRHLKKDAEKETCIMKPPLPNPPKPRLSSLIYR